MIQEMWKTYIEANPTNNPGERKALRAAFIAGAKAMLDHELNAQRLGLEFDASLSLVVYNQTPDLFDPAPEKCETDTPGNIDPKF